MPLVGLDYAKDLKAIIFDLDILALRAVLWAFVDHLTKKPSVEMGWFVECVLDARRYPAHDAQNEAELIGRFQDPGLPDPVLDILDHGEVIDFELGHDFDLGHLAGIELHHVGSIGKELPAEIHGSRIK